MLSLHSDDIPVPEVKMMTNIRTYSELITLLTFEERFRYLKLDGTVGKETFGFKRWLNQEFYHSIEWLNFRDKIIIRDGGCDLGVPGYDIHGSVLIHHINPITYEKDIFSSIALVTYLPSPNQRISSSHSSTHLVASPTL